MQHNTGKQTVFVFLRSIFFPFKILKVIDKPLWNLFHDRHYNAWKANVNRTEALFFVGFSPFPLSVFVLQTSSLEKATWVALGKTLFHQSMFYGIIGYFGVVFHSHLSQGTHTICANGFNAE